MRFRGLLVLLIGAVGAFFSLCPDSASAFDEFDTEHAPSRFVLSHEDLSLEIKGRARLGLHDLQGNGGPEYDSHTDTATIGTRSPFVELDSFDLSFRLNWNKLVWFNTNLAFYTDTTTLSAIYFEYEQALTGWFSHGVEIGYLSSFVATDRHTIRYPLIAIDYWKNPEYHLAYGAKFTLAPETSISAYASISFMRPLRTEPIHGSPTYAGSYSTLAYGSATPYSGNSAAGTFLLRFFTHGFFVEGFGQIGEIVTSKGLDTLMSVYPFYRAMDGFNANTLRDFVWWAGGRIAYNGYGIHLMAESIASQEHLIRRVGVYAQASYTYTRDSDFLNTFEILARYEGAWTLDSTQLQASGNTLRTPDINNAISWDHTIITLAARLRILKDILTLRVEYSFFLEDNDVKSRNLKQVDIDDNELLIQIEARY